MDRINKFNEFINNNINSVNEKYEINRYQYHLTRLLNKIDVDLYYVEKYKLSVLSFYPLINLLLDENFDNKLSIQDILLIIVIAINILVYENKDKTQKLLNVAMNSGLSEELVDYVVNIFNKIMIIFSDISEKMDKKITKFTQVLSYTELLVSFTRVLYLLKKDDMIDIENIDKNNKLKYKSLLDRISKKLIFMSNNVSKIKNIENLKPLFINDEFKSQGLKPEKRFTYNERINESLKDKMKGKSKDDVIKMIDKLNEEEKYNLLFEASKKGQLFIVKYIVDSGLDINIDVTNKFISTPLMLASENGHLDIVKFLVNNGADINMENFFGESALEWAIENKHDNIVKYLKRKIKENDDN